MKRVIRGLALILGASVPLAVDGGARADTKEECSALYDGTQTLRERGLLREARQRALACGTSSCGVHVKKDCTRWLAEIEASLPTVVFTAEDATGAETTAVRVTVDGRLLSERLDGKAVAIDPGERTLLFELEGSEAIERRVVIRQGEKNRILSVSFKKQAEASLKKQAEAARAPAPSPPPSVAALPEPDPPPRPKGPERDGGGAPLWAGFVGGAGIALVGVGGGFGISALLAQSSLVAACGGDIGRCPASKKSEATPLRDRRDLGRELFIGLGASGGAAIGACVLGILAPRKEPARASLTWAPFGSPNTAGVAVRGAF